MAQTIRLELVRPLPTSPGLDAEVYDSYLRARYLWDQRTAPAVRGAIRHFEKALEGDPAYAPAWAGLSNLRDAILPITSDSRPRESFPKAKEAAERALKIDSALPEAHVARGIAHFWFDWNWAAAERGISPRLRTKSQRLKRAYVSGPTYIRISHGTQKRLQRSAQTRRLDPLSLILNTHEGQFQYNARRYSDALAPLERVLELAPRFWIAHIVLGKVLGVERQHRKALVEFTKVYEYSEGNTEGAGLRGYTLGVMGKRAEARRELRKLDEQARGQYVPPLHRALVLLGIGERTGTLEALDNALDERDVRLTFLAVEPRWDPLRDAPRFKTIYKRVGLPTPKD